MGGPGEQVGRDRDERDRTVEGPGVVVEIACQRHHHQLVDRVSDGRARRGGHMCASSREFEQGLGAAVGGQELGGGWPPRSSKKL